MQDISWTLAMHLVVLQLYFCTDACVHKLKTAA